MGFCQLAFRILLVHRCFVFRRLVRSIAGRISLRPNLEGASTHVTDVWGKTAAVPTDTRVTRYLGATYRMPRLHAHASAAQSQRGLSQVHCCCNRMAGGCKHRPAT
eukprot:2388023-Pyramimonas_sp.AAC.1